MAKSKYVDVNKEKYMNALFLDIQKQSKMVDLTNKAEIIYDFVLNNPSNQDGVHNEPNKLNVKNGIVLISKRVG